MSIGVRVVNDTVWKIGAIRMCIFKQVPNSGVGFVFLFPGGLEFNFFDLLAFYHWLGCDTSWFLVFRWLQLICLLLPLLVGAI